MGRRRNKEEEKTHERRDAGFRNRLGATWDSTQRYSVSHGEGRTASELCDRRKRPGRPLSHQRSPGGSTPASDRRAGVQVTAVEFLPRLEAVRRSSRGYVARCPAHADRHPSLSVSEGERGILVKCWAGCTTKEIVGALGLTMRDLFYDSDQPASDWRSAYRERVLKRQRQEAAQYVDGLLVDSCREAERMIGSASGIDISGWSDERLDEALIALAEAYEVLEGEPTNV